MSASGRNPTRRLNVCVIASTYPRHERDYAVPWLRESVRRIVERGHRITVLAPSYKGLRDHEIDGIPVKRFRYAPKCLECLTHEGGAPQRIRNPLFKALGLPYLMRGTRAARRLGRSEHFDLVHVHWPFPHGEIGLAAAKASNAAMVVNCHGSELAMAEQSGWIARALRQSLLRGDVLVANSSDTAARVESLSGRESLVIPYGSTVTAHDRAEPRNRVPRILYTGRLIERKGVEFLLRAMPYVLAERPVKLIITGDGDQRRKLVTLTQLLHLEAHVEFLGFVPTSTLNREYATCDVWVNPSVVDVRGYTEGTSVGAIEAYTHRKPVVATTVGGIPDAVHHGKTGWLVPERDEFALARAIIDLINHPSRARSFGEAGLKLVQERFDWDHITDELETAYELAIHQRQLYRAGGSCEASPSRAKVGRITAA